MYERRENQREECGCEIENGCNGVALFAVKINFKKWWMYEKETKGKGWEK